MIEQVVEFKRQACLGNHDARPDVVAIAAMRTVEELRKLLIESRFSRVPVLRGISGRYYWSRICQDLLQVPIMKLRS